MASEVTLTLNLAPRWWWRIRTLRALWHEALRTMGRNGITSRHMRFLVWLRFRITVARGGG